MPDLVLDTVDDRRRRRLHDRLVVQNDSQQLPARRGHQPVIDRQPTTPYGGLTNASHSRRRSNNVALIGANGSGQTTPKKRMTCFSSFSDRLNSGSRRTRTRGRLRLIRFSRRLPSSHATCHAGRGAGSRLPPLENDRPAHSLNSAKPQRSPK
jgi:hypothetical protein